MSGKTRIAPTPSGFLHRGNLFAFALNWLMARKENLSILLRVDDLDRRRYRSEYLEDIFQSLEAMGIDYDEGPNSVSDFEKNWSQIHREGLYRDHLQELLHRDEVFPCACSRKEIQARGGKAAYDAYCLNRSYSWSQSAKLALRWKMNSGTVELQAWNQAKRSAGLAEQLHYPVLYSKDGHYAYQLSSLVDDLHFEISHIVRGEDLFDSSICQSLLAESLEKSGFRQIRFHHHPLIKSGSQKLSKSQDAPAAKIYENKSHQEDLRKDLAQYLGLAESGKDLAELLEIYRES